MIERYETPTRGLSMDVVSCGFSSPSDPDGLNDIFWDQNSPMTKQLGKGRKKQIYTTDSDEISHIVNRIAPQDEKPVTNSMLGVWIGATAIPCTPSVAEDKSRMKTSCTKLKTQYREKELMKLAEQFDKNMEELDVIQEQTMSSCDFIQSTSAIGNLHSSEESIQKPSLCDVASEVDSVSMKKPVNRRTSVTSDHTSRQKLFDPSTEAAFSAIFDGSTQVCSGQLSQVLPEALPNSTNTTFEKKSDGEKVEIFTNETLVSKNLPHKGSVSLSSQVENAIIPKPRMPYCPGESEASPKHVDVFASNDFEDDWESLLGDEPTFMQNTEMLELFPCKTDQVIDHEGIGTIINKKSTPKTNVNLVGDSKITQGLTSDTHNREIINTGGYRFSANPNGKSSKLSLTGNKMKIEKSFNKIVTQDKVQDHVVCNLTKVKEDSQTNFTSNVHGSNKSRLKTRCPNEQKYGFIVNQPSKTTINTDDFGSTSLGNETNICNSNQINASKLGAFLDDWNDPLFASEMIAACHQLETSWETDDVDDDLLYQACDDIERLTQQESMKGSKVTESIGISKCARNIPTACQLRNPLGPSKHSNVGSTSAQSYLTDNSQVDGLRKMDERETNGDYSHFLNAKTHLSRYSKNSNSQVNSLQFPVRVNSSKSILAESSTLNTEVDTKKLSTWQVPHNTLADETHSGLNNRLRFSKFTFKMKTQLNQNRTGGCMPTTKITEDLEKKELNSSLEGAGRQQFLVKPSKEEEEKNRKYSPEEIQRKRQEALVRRMARTQASSANSVPASFL